MGAASTADRVSTAARVSIEDLEAVRALRGVAWVADSAAAPPVADLEAARLAVASEVVQSAAADSTAVPLVADLEAARLAVASEVVQSAADSMAAVAVSTVVGAATVADIDNSQLSFV